MSVDGSNHEVIRAGDIAGHLQIMPDAGPNRRCGIVASSWKSPIAADIGKDGLVIIEGLTNWVYCRMFLDRAAAFDRGAGRRAEVQLTLNSARSD